MIRLTFRAGPSKPTHGVGSDYECWELTERVPTTQQGQIAPEVVYYVACSLDGYIAGPDGSVEWLTPFQAGGEDYGYREFYSSVEGLLMGSHTYDVSLKLGPWQAKDRPSWVFTRRSLEVVHPSVTLTDAEPPQVMDTLRERGLKRVWLMGGGQLVSSFRTAGLITHYMISIVPVVLGSGIPLFADAEGPEVLRLVEAKSYASGIVQLNYEPEQATSRQRLR